MRREELRPVYVVPARYVRVGPTAEAATGISEGAMVKMIERSVWKRGREWVKGPDGRRYVDLRAFEAWVESAGDQTHTE